MCDLEMQIQIHLHELKTDLNLFWASCVYSYLHLGMGALDMILITNPNKISMCTESSKEHRHHHF